MVVLNLVRHCDHAPPAVAFLVSFDAQFAYNPSTTRIPQLPQAFTMWTGLAHLVIYVIHFYESEIHNNPLYYEGECDAT